MRTPSANTGNPATRLAAAALGGVVAATLTGCGGDDAAPTPADDRVAAVEALSAALARDADPGGGAEPVLSPDEAGCQAAAIVDELGVEALVAQGILDGALTSATLPKDATSPAVKQANAAAISDCVGIVDYTLRITRTVLGTLAQREGGERYAVSDEQWAEVVACAERRLPEASVRARAVAHPEQPLLSKRQLTRLAPCEPSVFGS